jgi:hypothetical protein
MSNLFWCTFALFVIIKALLTALGMTAMAFCLRPTDRISTIVSAILATHAGCALARRVRAPIRFLRSIHFQDLLSQLPFSLWQQLT